MYETLMQTRVQNWMESLMAFKHPRVITMLFFGFSAGIPILLIFSSLSLWLREAGVERSAVTYFSWAALGYSFKFVWAPLVDRIPIPYLTTSLGRRRSWILLSQLLVITSILMMAFVDPQQGQSAMTIMAIGAVFLGFSSATQDIVIDAYRIESAGSELQALMSSTYIAGYRVGMIVAGAGALFLASWFGTSMDNYVYTAWKWTYVLMALTMMIGVATTLFIPEPKTIRSDDHEFTTEELFRFLLMFAVSILAFIGIFASTRSFATTSATSLTDVFGNKHLAGFIVELIRLGIGFVGAFLAAKILMIVGVVQRKTFHKSYIEPIQDFFQRYSLKGAAFLLLLIGLYRISDIVLGVISNVFYQDLGFSKNEIASISKTFGLIMTILGAFFGGILSKRFGVMRILLLGAILSAGTNLLFMLLAQMGHSMPMLMSVIAADNLSAGISFAAFIAFLSALTSIEFTAVQYAIFSSLMTLFPKIIGGYSGTMVDALGYPTFFLITALMGIPVIFLIIKARHKVELKLPN